MFLRYTLLVLATLGLAAGDTLTLRNGEVVQGTFISGDSREVRMVVGDRVQSFDISTVKTIQFGATPAAAPAKPAEPSQPRTSILRPDRAAVSIPASSTSRSAFEIPAGSSIVVRMIDDVDSQRDNVGQTFRASLDEPIVVNGETVVPRGADVVAKLVADKESGKLSGRTELTMDLVSMTVNGKTVDLLTQEVTTASESRTGRTAKVVGGGTALGAIIGAVAGGGKGAAIGAVTGAAAGGAVQVLTKGQQVKIPSETRLTFTLQQPIKL